MKKAKLLKNKYLWILIGTFVVFPLVIISIPSVDDPLISIASQFGWSVNPDSNAPSSVLQALSISYPNTFSSCSFGDRIYYTDNTGKKNFLDGNLRDITPFYSNSLITTQTNRQLVDFLIETHGSCSINVGGTFSNAKAVADSGKVTIDVYYANQYGLMTKIYSKSTELNVKGLNLSSDKILHSAKISASELESKMAHTSDVYKSNIRIKTTMDLYLHYEGVQSLDTTKWFVGGVTQTDLKVNVQNDKFQCLTCFLGNKEIKTEFTPSDHQVKPRTIMSFKVTLPAWDSGQGSPSYKIVNAETGAEITQSSQIPLTQYGDNGIGSKSLLSPTNVGKYDIVITKQGRDTAIISFNVYKPTVVPPGEPKEPGNECPEGYVFVNNDCFLKKSEDGGEQPEEKIDKFLDWLNNFNPEDYYGYIGLLIFILILIIILKSVLKSSPPRY